MNIIVLYVQILFKRKKLFTLFIEFNTCVCVCVYDQIIMSVTIFWNIFLPYFYSGNLSFDRLRVLIHREIYDCIFNSWKTVCIIVLLTSLQYTQLPSLRVCTQHLSLIHISLHSDWFRYILSWVFLKHKIVLLFPLIKFKWIHFS